MIIFLVDDQKKTETAFNDGRKVNGKTTQKS
jgi:hypothetical protein